MVNGRLMPLLPPPSADSIDAAAESKPAIAPTGSVGPPLDREVTPTVEPGSKPANAPIGSAGAPADMNAAPAAGVGVEPVSESPRVDSTSDDTLAVQRIAGYAGDSVVIQCGILCPREYPIRIPRAMFPTRASSRTEVRPSPHHWPVKMMFINLSRLCNDFTSINPLATVIFFLHSRSRWGPIVRVDNLFRW